MANISNIKVKAGNTLVASGSAVEITGSQVRTSGDLRVLKPANGSLSVESAGQSVDIQIINTTSSIEPGALLGDFKVRSNGSGDTQTKGSIRVNYTGSSGDSAMRFLVGSGSGDTDTIVRLSRNEFGGIELLKNTTVNGTLSSSGDISTAGDVSVAKNLYVTGTISASVMTISETIVSSSIVHHSGSTKFGDEASDTHVFSGSVNISGTVTATKFVGALALEQRTVTASVSVSLDDYALFADTSVNSAAITLTLPAPTTGGRELVIKKVDSTEFAVTLSASAGTIDGENPVDIFGPFQSVTLIANGTDKWFIV